MQNLQVFCWIRPNRSTITSSCSMPPLRVWCGDRNVLVIHFRKPLTQTAQSWKHFPTQTVSLSPPQISSSVSGLAPLFIWHQHYRRLEPSKGRPLRLRSLVVRWSGGPREAVRVLGAGGESWSSIKLSGLPSASPSGRLPQLEPGDMVSIRSSLAKPTTLSWCCSPWGPTSCAPTSSPVSPSVVLLTFLPPSWSSRRLDRKLMYFIASRRISFLLNFLSGGWVGMSLRSSANAPFTFCCRQRSRLLVKMRRTIFGWPATKTNKQTNKRYGGSEKKKQWQL